MRQRLLLGLLLLLYGHLLLLLLLQHMTLG